MALPFPIQVFDPAEEYTVWEGRRLPHWGQVGTVCFITWRTWDSIPSDVLEGWRKERSEWLSEHGIDPLALDWKAQLLTQFPVEGRMYLNLISERWENCLNEGRGACVLVRPECRRTVYESLLHFDDSHYSLLDFVIMPNHVHVLAAFPSAESMASQIRSWKRFTAGEINRQLALSGRLWQTEDFDHLVRSEYQFQHFRQYIAANPRKAGLAVQEHQHYSKNLMQGNSM